ncbi:hypothetical protein BDV12DRAFT_200675 [Aspergillus spectabilis]
MAVRYKDHLNKQWINLLDHHLTSPDLIPLSKLFHDDSWWRDMLALTWDFRTIRGLGKSSTFIKENQSRVQLATIRLDQASDAEPKFESPVKGLTWVTALFTFETRVGRGSGVVYITQPEEGGRWKAYSVYTVLRELKGCEERLGTRRPDGKIASMPDGLTGENWLESRTREIEFSDGDPVVLIIGAGQSGLNLTARLQALGQKCLIVEKNNRTLVTHEYVETCHMAYLPFPRTWPKYLPKDKLADWLETYAAIMELNVWTKTEIMALENRTPTEIKNILSESLPWPVTLALGVDLTKRISETDKDTLDGLERAGFRLGFGTDGAGIL